MDRISNTEQTYGQDAGYRKGQQRDVVDSIGAYLIRGNGLLFGTRDKLASKFGCKPAAFKRAVNDPRFPFNRYRVITDRDIGHVYTLPEVSTAQAFRYARNSGAWRYKLIMEDGSEYLKVPYIDPEPLTLTEEEVVAIDAFDMTAMQTLKSLSAERLAELDAVNSLYMDEVEEDVYEDEELCWSAEEAA
ncbi:hypothetical protein PAHA111176_15635 [Parendozoicomonas haliclonae]|uniref:Uncharacterized protein n=2 Tax=Parendozoicomonas haliclonae TaxID=1960125 RepID=A0A1X7AHF2_9GAMM|nr:hypothetical protein EHSB41UT_01257 [Parendozoicomonas haliclonae]